MSNIVVSSTTDSQEDVNSAASVAPKPSEVPPEPEIADDPESPDETEQPEDDGEEEQPSRRKASYQQRIDRLTRDKYQLRGRLEELERRLNQPPPQQPRPVQQEQSTGEPQESNFPTYDAYIKALTQYQVRQNVANLHQQIESERAQRQAAQAQQQQVAQWHERANAFSETTPDFASALTSVDDIPVPPALQYSLVTHERGPELAYHLAKHPAEWRRIASIPDPAQALHALGKFEALHLNSTAQTKELAASKAPPPINPVGQGSMAKTTKRPDEMTFQEYKRWRVRNGAR